MHMRPHIVPSALPTKCPGTTAGTSPPLQPSTQWVAHVTGAHGIITRVEIAAPDRLAAVRAALDAVPGGQRVSLRLIDPSYEQLLDALALRRSPFPLVTGAAR